MCYVDSSHLAVKLHFFPRSHTILLRHSSSLHSTPQYDSWSRDRGEPSTTLGYTGSCPPLAVPVCIQLCTRVYTIVYLRVHSSPLVTRAKAG